MKSLSHLSRFGGAMGRSKTVRAIALMAVWLTCRWGVANCDDAPTTPDALKPPSSPAFVLLGLSPTSIERPTTGNSAVLSLVSGIEDIHAAPGQFALETAPYWWSSHRNLTWQDMGKDMGQTILETTAFSIAMQRASADTGQGAKAKVAAGFHTLLRVSIDKGKLA